MTPEARTAMHYGEEFNIVIVQDSATEMGKPGGGGDVPTAQEDLG